MNRNKLKTYAPKARRDFIAAVTARAAKFGITKDAAEPVQVQGNVAVIAGQAHPKKVAEQRAKLEARIKTRGFEQVMEEAAYTWFNRFAAIRYMEVHGYLDHGYRVLSHPEGKATPEIVEHAQHLDLPGLDREKVIELKLDGTKEGELYRMLLLAQCNALHTAMPFLFERIDDETELLLPDNLLHSDSVIRQMVTEIDEEDWQEIEIIGWLYQFYISEKKDQVIGKVVKSEDIPAATQLFTPNWIVKYMVQNTLGAKWLATYPQSGIRAKMEFYIEPAEQTEDVKAKLAQITPKELNPEEITFLDPACGSGHILVEAYDLFKEIYLERGYVLRDIPRLILEKNLYGLDIDDRAAQMAAFALLMKARRDDRRILASLTPPSVASIGEFDLGQFVENKRCFADITEISDALANAKSIGSLMLVTQQQREQVLSNLTEHKDGELALGGRRRAEIDALTTQITLLSRQYDCVAANPPYLDKKGMNSKIKSYSSQHYQTTDANLYSMFIKRCLDFAAANGFVGMLTMDSWMHGDEFTAFRAQIPSRMTISSLAHLGPRAFDEIPGEVVQVAAFAAVAMSCDNYTASYRRIIEPKTSEAKRAYLLSGDGFYFAKMETFKQFPRCIFAYHAGNAEREAFNTGIPLSNLAEAFTGLQTGDNPRFIRYWHEVSFDAIAFGARDRDEAKQSGRRWFPYVKGSDFKKWFGNNRCVVDWAHDGASIRKNESSVVRNQEYYFSQGFAYNNISKQFSARYVDSGYIFDQKNSMFFSKSYEDNMVALGFMNSRVVKPFLDILCPKDFNAGSLKLLPIPRNLSRSPDVIKEVETLVHIARQDWNSSEVSWGFESHPLLCCSNGTVSASFHNWSMKCFSKAREAREGEARINKHFIDALKLTGDIPSCVTDADITLRFPHLKNDVRSLVSYAIGCMMGRYSIDKRGLVYAKGGNIGFDSSNYQTFTADDDGIVPIMQTDWFDDDAANRFVEFVRVAWSPETLAENLKFVADSLGAKAGEMPSESIRRYLSVDFFKDHLQAYKKRPIYWLFSSGKEKAFEALVYLHRYNEGTLSRMRMEYVTPLQGRISARIDQLDRDIAAAGTTAQQNKLRKEQEKLKKQQAELIKFDEQLRHYADMRIKLDLDDGVKVNYGKFGTLLAEVKAITGGGDD